MKELIEVVSEAEKLEAYALSRLEEEFERSTYGDEFENIGTWIDGGSGISAVELLASGKKEVLSGLNRDSYMDIQREIVGDFEEQIEINVGIDESVYVTGVGGGVGGAEDKTREVGVASGGVGGKYIDSEEGHRDIEFTETAHIEELHPANMLLDAQGSVTWNLDATLDESNYIDQTTLDETSYIDQTDGLNSMEAEMGYIDSEVVYDAFDGEYVNMRTVSRTAMRTVSRTAGSSGLSTLTAQSSSSSSSSNNNTGDSDSETRMIVETTAETVQTETATAEKFVRFLISSLDVTVFLLESLVRSLGPLLRDGGALAVTRAKETFTNHGSGVRKWKTDDITSPTTFTASKLISTDTNEISSFSSSMSSSKELGDKPQKILNIRAWKLLVGVTSQKYIKS